MEDLEKSVDLANICRRALSAWQYIDTKMRTEKLVAVEHNSPYPSSFTNPFLHPIHTDTEVTKNWKCTKFIAENDQMLTTALGKVSISTVKNFFKLSGEENLSFKKKQLIYWQIRLRYACGIIPISILKMVPYLKKLGYDSWKLSNGVIVSQLFLSQASVHSYNDVIRKDDFNIPYMTNQTLVYCHQEPESYHQLKIMTSYIPFSSAWLGDIVVVPERYNVVQTTQTYGKTHMNNIIEPIEGFGGVVEKGPFADHSIIMMKTTEEKLFVLDPTSLQFSLEGENSSLVYFSTWEEYVENFPGIVIQTAITKHDAIDRLNIKWDIGNKGFNHCKKLIEAILKDFHQTSCDHCGEVAGAMKNINLKKCASCKKVNYCDKLCQKIAWKSHRDSCSKIGS